MGYSDAKSRRERAITVGAVAVFHVAIGVALVNQFAATIIPHIDQIIRTFPVAAPTPKPSDPPLVHPIDPVQHPLARPAPVPENPFNQIITLPEPNFGPSDGGSGGLGELTFDHPSPTPDQLPIKAARPLGNSGIWVTANDYPTGELRAAHSGVSRLRLELGSNGRVSNCAVITSSGWPVLDHTACALVTQRGRFVAASDSTGALVGGDYTMGVRWQIPE